jgi:hypothetical protein
MGYEGWQNDNIVRCPLAVANYSNTVYLLQEGNITFKVPHIPRNESVTMMEGIWVSIRYRFSLKPIRYCIIWREAYAKLYNHFSLINQPQVKHLR